jgi:hypothetical protein
MVCSHGIPTVPRNRKLSEFHSKPFYGREKSSEFRTVKQNRRKLSEFRSKPFCGGENNSEFSSVKQKYKQTFGILFQSISRKKTGNFCFGSLSQSTAAENFRKNSEKTTFVVRTNHFVKLF